MPGAIMVLFVFVIMLLNAGVEEETKGSRVALLFGVPGVLTSSVLMAWVVVRHSVTGVGADRRIAGASHRDCAASVSRFSAAV